MKLDKKYFPHFMVVMAILSAMIIVYSSFRFEESRRERYIQSVAANDSLLTQPFQFVLDEGETSIADHKGNYVVLVFWSSWSDISYQLLDEMYTLKDQRDDLVVLAALVKDATESLDPDMMIPDFFYVDGANTYNDLKVPGIPSYILFDTTGMYLYAHIGYQEGAGYSVLKEKINE